ncbi:MAG: DUF1501 domain-containing protein [Acidobacteria bacterium]|nr:DUF1501 domain-containing protein [Acidobacteriota bacterium]
MDTLTRRKFLSMTAGVVAASAAAPVLRLSDIAEAAINRPLPSGTPILVLVTLYGGNDGLNTVIPYTDPIYFSSRPNISYKQDLMIPLDSQLAFNPSMKSMKALWDARKVAIVRGVGYPKPDRSHFSSMAKWQTASPERHINTGWIGRWVDSQPEDSMLAISLGSVLPPLFAGAKRSGSVLPLGGLTVPSGTLGMQCQQLAKPSRTDSSLMASAASSMRNLFSVSSTVQPILKAPAPASANLPTVAGGNAGGDNNLSAQLDIVAKLISAGSPTRVWSVSLGGFDTHANEANAQSVLLGVVSDSIARFLSQLSGTSRSSDVTVVIYSEFGRRVVGNGSQGTDHGTSGPMFIIGDKVNGGFYGDQPSLKNLINGDLAVTTDFRDVYSTLIEKVLQSPPDQVLGRWSGRTQFMRV